jgi:hypothetical protein
MTDNLYTSQPFLLKEIVDEDKSDQNDHHAKHYVYIFSTPLQLFGN